jgi:uncharacterized membrane protein (UPF0182 family)
VRRPDDVARPPRATSHRRRNWIIVALIVVIALIASLRTFAVFYTDALWFSSVRLHSVWRSLFEIKAGLMITFCVIFAALLLTSLIVAERLAPKGEAASAEDDFVKRYQEVIGPYARWIRAAVVIILSLIVGSQALGQWQNWIFFRNGVNFGTKDPVWHKDIGFFVFRLPFENFLVHWALVALIVIFLVTVLFHYLNGGIRVQGPKPRVRPAVKAHISVILGLMALVKAVGYYLQRYNLDNSTDGYVNGPGYTDIHARLPALQLLILVSLAAFLLLIFNIRRQGWALPVLGVGMWFLVALTAGAIYPAAVQAFKVNPAQNTLERPYIQRNITATRDAMNLNGIQSIPYPAVTPLNANTLNANSATTANVRLWDPTVTQATYDKKQDIRSYYNFNSLGVDRYDIAGKQTPAVVGVREINDQDLPAASWVNTHLQFTHGYGMIVSPANQTTTNGDPVFGVGGVPPFSTKGLPKVTQPSVYFGLNEPGYVVGNTKQPEIDYQQTNNTNQESHYSGDGGVKLGSFFNRIMFAFRFGDINMLISDQLTNNSRVMFDRQIQTRVAKAAPFLSLDSDPYAALVNGHIDFIQDAYTTTDSYPYAQNANTSALSSASGLPANFNYIRNSVKVVTDAYTGMMTFYVMNPNDPIIRTYERAFPNMFTPASKMPAALRAHIRYPEDIFTVQASMFGKYHITNAASFYSAADAWTISPTPGSGSPSAALATTQTLNAQGEPVSTGQVVKMAPIYQELEVPGQTQQSFTLLDALVPVSNSSQIQTLSGFMMAGSDPGHYGQLQMFVTPRGQPVDGPALVAARIDATQSISSRISLLNQNGSSVELGNVLMVPIAGSLLYIQPVYVQSSRNSFPELQGVIAVYGKQAAMGPSPTDDNSQNALQDALTQVFSAPVSTTPGGGGTLSPQVQSLLEDAQAAYTQSKTDLSAGNLGAYQTDIGRMESDLEAIQQLTGTTTPGTTSPTTSTTTTVPGTTKNGKTTTSTTTGKGSTTTTVKPAPKTTTPSTAPA